MHFFIIVLAICFFIFLFSLFSLTHDDFVLLRKDISEKNIFDIAFLLIPAALFFSRLFYVFFHPSLNFLNPLYFLLFPYFPGLSLVGGILGGGLSLFLIFSVKKMPVLRLMDLFMMAFISSMPVGVLGYFILSGQKLLSLIFIFEIVSYVFLLFVFIFIAFPKFLKGRVKEGTMSTLFLLFFSASSLIEKIIVKSLSFKTEEIIYSILLIASTVIIVKKENIIEATRRLIKK